MQGAAPGGGRGLGRGGGRGRLGGFGLGPSGVCVHKSKLWAYGSTPERNTLLSAEMSEMW